jgi:enediyne biosynthesis protein E4
VITTARWLRKQLPGVVALALMLALFVAGRPHFASAQEKQQVATPYKFTPASIALPGGFKPQTIRKVNKDYQRISAWISSVGAGVAMNDLDGDGLANDLCVTDPRIDKVVVTPAPGKGAERYAPFALNTGTLPMGPAIAPMGCVPNDFNHDGRTDLLVYYWGRVPTLHLAQAGGTGLSAGGYLATELMPGDYGTGTYTGPIWNTNTATVADFDADGNEDFYIGNYFADGAKVLDDTVAGGVEMNDSMSGGFNGGRDYFFRWTGTAPGGKPTFECRDDVLPDEVSTSWGLGASATDLDGDLKPELYLANDFAPDRLLHNVSTPGKIAFALVEGARTPMVPKSKVVGHDSFKGMGVDFGDLDNDGLYDAFVSNITTPYGIQESNFQFQNTAKDEADVRAQFANGTAPFTDVSGQTGTAWSGWGWDVKMADFDNSGNLAIVQATGFVKGQVNRWAQLQELATANDFVVHSPKSWPILGPGADIAGSQTLAFFAKSADGRYANIAHDLGLAIPVPTRGVATGDADGDGRLDLVVARQWDEAVFYHNDSAAPGAQLTLALTHQGSGTQGTAGSPVIGAQVCVITADGRKHVARVDGGSGHSGRRSWEVHLGLGANVTGPVKAHITWRDRTGQTRQQDLQLTPGRHAIELGAQAKEK